LIDLSCFNKFNESIVFGEIVIQQQENLAMVKMKVTRSGCSVICEMIGEISKLDFVQGLDPRFFQFLQFLSSTLSNLVFEK